MFSSKDKTLDMTTGTPWKLMVTFAVPMLISSLFQQMYSMVDSAIVGQGIGGTALGAIGSTGALSYLIIGFLMGLTGGFSILFAQFFGAKDMDSLRRSYTGALRVGIGIALIFTVLSLVFTDWLLETMLHTPAEMYVESKTYITVIFASTPILMAYNIFGAFLRSVGDSKTPLYAMVASTITNLILDILFVIVLPWGVLGAAAATTIAQVVAAVWCWISIRKTGLANVRKGDWAFNLQLDKKLLFLGLPLAFQTSITAIGAVFLQRLVNEIGALCATGYAAAERVMYFAEMPGSCLGIAMATYSGQNMGAKRIDRIRLGVNQTLPLSAVINLVLGIVMAIFAKELVSIFIKAEELEGILPYARQLMIVQGCMKWILGPLFIYRNALQGMGDTRTPMLSGFVELGMRLGMANLLVASLSFLGICIADVSAWVGAEIMLMVVYYVRMRKLKLTETPAV